VLPETVHRGSISSKKGVEARLKKKMGEGAGIVDKKESELDSEDLGLKEANTSSENHKLSAIPED